MSEGFGRTPPYLAPVSALEKGKKKALIFQPGLLIIVLNINS